jgi:hypothetical protein
MSTSNEKSTELPTVITYPREAVLRMEHLVAVLGVTDETIGRMDLPSFRCGNRQRFIWGQVLDALAARASSVAAPIPIDRKASKPRLAR